MDKLTKYLARFAGLFNLATHVFGFIWAWSLTTAWLKWLAVGVVVLSTIPNLIILGKALME